MVASLDAKVKQEKSSLARYEGGGPVPLAFIEAGVRQVKGKRQTRYAQRVKVPGMVEVLRAIGKPLDNRKPRARPINPFQKAPFVANLQPFPSCVVCLQPITPDPFVKMVCRNCAVEGQSRGIGLFLEVGKIRLELGKEVM